MKFSNLMMSAAVGAMLAFGAADALAAFYRRGDMTCGYFEKREKDANKTIYADNVNVQLIYAFCLVVKGESTGNQSEVNKGLSMLYHFADDKDHVFANFFWLNIISQEELLVTKSPMMVWKKPRTTIYEHLL